MTTLAIGPDTYDVAVYPLPATTETNPMPLDLAIGGGKVWLGCEFDRRIYSLDLAATPGTAMTAHTIPTPEGFFRTTVLGNDIPTLQGMVEDIDVDATGDVWVAQSGAPLYAGPHPNYARLLRYTPATDSWLAYALPWRNCGTAGLYVDNTDGRGVWVALNDPHCGTTIARTRPGVWTNPDPMQPGIPVEARGAWEMMPAPKPGSWPAHIVRGNDGRLYSTLYWGNAVVAWHPDTLAMQVYELPPPSPPASGIATRGPWQMAVGVFGAIWIPLDGAAQVAKLDPVTGVFTLYTPGFSAGEHPHSVVLDNVLSYVWISSYTLTTELNADGRLARRNNSTGEWVFSAPLSSLGYARGAAGLALNGSDLWVALFGAQAVMRLRKVS